MEQKEILDLINNYSKEVLIPTLAQTSLETQISIFTVLATLFDESAKCNSDDTRAYLILLTLSKSLDKIIEKLKEHREKTKNE